MSTLEDRVALVTGGGKGIGKAIARDLARAGATVAVNYARDADAAAGVVREIERDGGRALAVQADVSQPEAVARMFDQVVETLGEVAILVNNAAVYSFQPLEQITIEEFHRQYDTNVLGLLLTTQRFAAQAPAQGAAIVNVLTAGISANLPGSALYTSTKGAASTLTRILAKELAPRGIRVNAIAPGATNTEGAQALGMIDGPMVEGVVAATPLGRLGQPDDIGPVAVFLASDAAHWVTGDIVYASGGAR